MIEKKVLHDFDIEEDSDEDETPDLLAKVCSNVKVEERLKNGFESNFLKGNLLNSMDEDDDYTYVIIPCESTLNGKPQQTNKLQKKSQQKKEFQENQKLQMEDADFLAPVHRSIQMLGEIQYESSDSEETDKQIKESIFESNQEMFKNEEKKEKEEKNNPSRSSIARIDFDESDEDAQNSESSSESHHKQLRKILTLKPHQLEKVNMKDIALTNDAIQNMKIFTKKEVQMSKILNLKLIRNESGLKSIWPSYQIYLNENGLRTLHAKKMAGCTTSNFYITLEPDIDDVHHDLFLAKMRSNFWNNIYNVFSKGVNPNKVVKNQKIRQIEATIVFQGQKQVRQPRSFYVYILAKKFKYRDLKGYKAGEQISLDNLYEFEDNKGKIFKFSNRKPVYSAAIEGYILNFSGRVQLPSIKNFILEDVIAHREALMFGKSQNNIFRIDVSWPLKPYIALCICLANMDSSYTSE